MITRRSKSYPGWPDFRQGAETESREAKKVGFSALQKGGKPDDDTLLFGIVCSTSGITSVSIHFWADGIHVQPRKPDPARTMRSLTVRSRVMFSEGLVHY